MKIIDLLNKIANGGEVPKKIKFKNNIYGFIERNDNVYNYKQIYNGRFIDNYLCDGWFMDSEAILNDEVEIIEEDKKIEKIDHLIVYDIRQFEDLREYMEITIYDLFGKTNKIIDKINEIIDIINKGDNND